MERTDLERYRGMKNSRIWSGFILIIAGILLLAYKMGAPIPGWIFTWPVLLILIGLITGIKSRFQNPGSYILILIGTIFLVDQSIPGINFHNYIVPLILIGLGLIFIIKPRGNACERRRRHHWRAHYPYNNPSNDDRPEDASTTTDHGEYIDVHAMFGGINKNIQSKNFKGGEIVSFMGGSEINFLQADIQHPIVLEVNNVFGSTKLIIPANWDVKNEISAIFGGIEDKRNFQNSTPDPGKVILLKGACVFGGIEVTNY
ncbi:MAG: LiaF-related protein [Bacteroidota bacterium]|nr:LiaF-related protein [Bacteroidota bacterium]